MVGSTADAAEVVAADPDALHDVRRVGASTSWALTREGRSLSAALAAAGPSVPAWARGLGDELVALASAWEELDGWVGRLGDAIADADVLVGPMPQVRAVAAGVVAATVAPAPTWVDGLTDAEAEAQVLAAARRLRPFAPFLTGPARAALRAQLQPLWARVRAQWPDAVLRDPRADASRCVAIRPMPKGLDEALDLLALPGEGRRWRTAGVAEAVLTGFVAGADFDGYDDPRAELTRTGGHVASGLLGFGDARDAFIESLDRHWGAAFLAAAGIVPIAGDAARGLGSADEVVEGVAELRRFQHLADGAGGSLRHIDIDELDALGGHIRTHVGKSTAQLRSRLLAEPDVRFASSFHDETVAEAAITSALEGNDPYIRRITDHGQTKTVFRSDVGFAVGEVVPQVGPPAPTTVVEVVLKRAVDSDAGFRVHSAYPVRGMR